ncbi:hypothetical protein ACGFXC_03685 [Streptomyces sp. NPDC048507]|uniref:hypothetical protein n=1 Tax=Streptomyces sp. NPDC048507 TaxID=3365560 RepID=UPI0037239CC4
MRRTLTVAAAVAAASLVLPGGPLPVTRTDSAQAAQSRWTAREAIAFWTPERMAAALPVPDPAPAAGGPAAGGPAAGAGLPADGPGATAPATGTAPADGVPAVAPPPAGAAPGVAAPPAGPAPGGGTGPGTTAPPADPAPADPAPAAPDTGGAVGPAPAPQPADASGPAVPLPPAPPGPASPVAPSAGPAGPSEPPGPSAPATAPAPPAPVPSPAAPTRAPGTVPATTGVGQDFDGIPAVGRMYVMKGSGAYFCTASVVSSPGRNLVVSAGHCLLGSDTRQVAFVPRYTRSSPRPYGMFPVLRDSAGHASVWIDQRYKTQGAEKAATLDVAFAAVGPNAEGIPVEKAVGGNRLVTGATFAHAKVTLIGHPASAARPRVCVNRTTKFTSTDPKSPGSFLRIDCTGYPGGTSGGPFLARYDEASRTGDLVGVIGGWKTGGPTADTSYSSYFGAEIRKLYQAAVAGAKAA